MILVDSLIFSLVFGVFLTFSLYVLSIEHCLTENYSVKTFMKLLLLLPLLSINLKVRQQRKIVPIFRKAVLLYYKYCSLISIGIYRCREFVTTPRNCRVLTVLGKKIHEEFRRRDSPCRPFTPTVPRTLFVTLKSDPYSVTPSTDTPTPRE